MTPASEAQREAVEAMCKAQVVACSETTPCERCVGIGYHHGFGERGHGPDWCSVCGGAGWIPVMESDEQVMGRVLAALVSLGWRPPTRHEGEGDYAAGWRDGIEAGLKYAAREGRSVNDSKVQKFADWLEAKDAGRVAAALAAGGGKA